MQFIDTHIHLQDLSANNTPDIIRLCQEAGVQKLVCVSILEKDWDRVAMLYEQFPDVIVPAFGLHPWYVREALAGWAERLESFLQKYPNALIGETGLDRYRDEEFEPQSGFFKTHIELAKKYQRPLLVHAVRCPEWLDKYWKILPPKFVFHSYNNRRELLKKIIDAGGYVSLSSAMLRNREKEKIIPAIPKERLLLETDGPYQSAVAGQEGISTQIPQMAAEIATIRGEDLAEMAAQIYQNSLEFIYV